MHRPNEPDGSHPASVTVRVSWPWVGALASLLVTAIGSWAAAAVFVGPLFGYRVTSASAWHWSRLDWMLHLAPGGVAAVTGLVLLGGSSSSRWLKGPLGLLVVAAGAWLVVGPVAWELVGRGAPYLHAHGARTAVLRQAGAALGPGLALVALGAVIASRPPATVQVEPPGPTGPTWAPGGASLPVAASGWAPTPTARVPTVVNWAQDPPSWTQTSPGWSQTAPGWAETIPPSAPEPTESYPVVPPALPRVTPPPLPPLPEDGEPTPHAWSGPPG